jgi:hypothetical protein
MRDRTPGAIRTAKLPRCVRLLYMDPMASPSGFVSSLGQIDHAIIRGGPAALGIFVGGFPEGWARDLAAAREELEAIQFGLIDLGGEA